MTSEAFAMGSDLQHEAILPACITACLATALLRGPACSFDLVCAVFRRSHNL